MQNVKIKMQNFGVASRRQFKKLSREAGLINFALCTLNFEFSCERKLWSGSGAICARS